MDLSVPKKRIARALGGLLALSACAGTMHAANTLLTYTFTTGVTCNTTTGPGAGKTITVAPAAALAGGNATAQIVVTAPLNSALVSQGVSISPATATIKTGTTTAVFTVVATAGCVGFVNAVQPTIQFQSSQTLGSGTVTIANDGLATMPANSLTATTSGLVANAVTVTCGYGGGVWIPGLPQTVSVTSTAAANGGTPFSVDTLLANDPITLVLNPLAQAGTAGASPITFTVAAAAGCGGFTSGNHSVGPLHLLNLPGPFLPVAVTIKIVPLTPLTITPALSAPSVSMTYVKSSGNVGYSDAVISSSPTGLFFTVNTATLPIWLTVDFTSGTASKALRFSTTGFADSLSPGTYTATVYIQVSTYADLAVPVTLLVTNKPSKLTVNSQAVGVTWVAGSPTAPTTTITATSNGSPIQYSIATGGLLSPIVTNSTQQSGLAFSFGTAIPISFPSLVLASAVPGNVLTGTVTFTWGSPASTTVVTISLTVTSPGAVLSGVFPASLPTGAVGAKFPLSLTGSGFIGGSDPTTATRVGIVPSGLLGGAITLDANVAITAFNNPSNMVVTITLPTSDPLLTVFSQTGAGGPIYLGLCNGTCTLATGIVTVTVGSGPVIQGITSSSTFTQVSGSTLPTIAPYDMISIFGANFCSSGGTGCSSATLLSGTPDPVSLRYPSTLPLLTDLVINIQRSVSVTFTAHSTTPGVPGALIGTSPLLFVTNGQINTIVPAAVTGYIGAATVDIYVNFGYLTGATLLKSLPFAVNVAATDPGVFTVGSDGQGAAAALASGTYALITGVNPAGMRNGVDSDQIQLYVTGLGLPTSTWDPTATGAGTIAAGLNCIAASGSSSYQTALNSATGLSLANIDGDVIQNALIGTGTLPPCLTSLPTVKIGGVSATVSYAAFVGDTVAGLYQINLQLPTTVGTFYPYWPLTTGPITNLLSNVQLPVEVTVGGNKSQAGATIWVAPRLAVAPPAGISGLTVGHFYTGTVVATEGTSTYQYAITSGVLPSGLSLIASTGVISGIPAANTGGTAYSVTVTATDSANIPVTGSVKFDVVVAGGLYVTSTVPTLSTFGAVNNAIATVTATGGTFPYNTYLITAPVTPVVGLSITSGLGSGNGILKTSGTTPAGTYSITVTAYDATALSGTYTFTIVNNLAIAHTGPVSQATTSGLVLSTVSATGSTGTIVYTLDAASVTAGLDIDATTGAVTTGTAIAGTFAITVTATDGTAPANATSAGVGTTTFSVIVTP
jgi:hypothetical protein